MKTSALAVLLFCATLGFGQRYYAPAPSYQWRTVASEVSFPLTLDGPARAAGPLSYGQVAIHVRANKPVSFAFIPAAWVATFRQEPYRLDKPQNRTGERCAAFSVTKGDTHCTLPPIRGGYYFAIVDERGICTECLVHGATALSGSLVGLAQFIGDMVADDSNRVTLSVQVPVCVANCGFRR